MEEDDFEPAVLPTITQVAGFAILAAGLTAVVCAVQLLTVFTLWGMLAYVPYPFALLGLAMMATGGAGSRGNFWALATATGLSGLLALGSFGWTVWLILRGAFILLPFVAAGVGVLGFLAGAAALIPTKTYADRKAELMA